MFDATHEAKTAKMKAAREKSVKDGFADLMESPLVKMQISMIPATDNNPGAIEMLLKAVYEAGHGKGEGHMMIGMLETLFKPRAGESAERKGGFFG